MKNSQKDKMQRRTHIACFDEQTLTNSVLPSSSRLYTCIFSRGASGILHVLVVSDVAHVYKINESQ